MLSLSNSFIITYNTDYLFSEFAVGIPETYHSYNSIQADITILNKLFCRLIFPFIDIKNCFLNKLLVICKNKWVTTQNLQVFPENQWVLLQNLLDSIINRRVFVKNLRGFDSNLWVNKNNRWVNDNNLLVYIIFRWVIFVTKLNNDNSSINRIVLPLSSVH